MYDSQWTRKITKFIAQVGSWTGDKNLLGENFNIAVDIEAFKNVFIEKASLWSHLTIELLTTEACKFEFSEWLHPQKVLKTKNSASIALSHLWTSNKTSAEPVFDVGLIRKDNPHP